MSIELHRVSYSSYPNLQYIHRVTTSTMECRHGRHDQLNVYQAIYNRMSSIYLQVYGLFVFMCLDEKMCSEANAFLSVFPVSLVATAALFWGKHLVS